MADTFKTLREFTPSPGKTGRYHSLAALEAAGMGKISRLPRSLRVVNTFVTAGDDYFDAQHLRAFGRPVAR